MATISNSAARLPGASPEAPVIPDVTVPEFVLGQAHLRGGKRALVDAGSGRELTYAELARAVREGGEWPKAALIKLTENLAAETRRYGISVLSVDPGLLPIGLTQSAMKSAPDPDTPSGRPAVWVQNQLASGRGADPDRAARLILRLAGGLGDRLSGRHVTVADDLDTLLARIDEIKRKDLYTLRLRTDSAA